jgi:hypothetical protein
MNPNSKYNPKVINVADGCLYCCISLYDVFLIFMQTFNFNVKSIHWPTYMESYCLGIKRFVLREELTELSKARHTLKRWGLLHSWIMVVMFCPLHQITMRLSWNEMNYEDIFDKYLMHVVNKIRTLCFIRF